MIRGLWVTLGANISHQPRLHLGPLQPPAETKHRYLTMADELKADLRKELWASLSKELAQKDPDEQMDIDKDEKLVQMKSTLVEWQSQNAKFNEWFGEMGQRYCRATCKTSLSLRSKVLSQRQCLRQGLNCRYECSLWLLRGSAEQENKSRLTRARGGSICWDHQCSWWCLWLCFGLKRLRFHIVWGALGSHSDRNYDLADGT